MLYQDPSADHRRYPLHEPRINNPPCYAGEPTECRAFLTQCEVVFSLQPQTYAGDPARIAFVLSLLTGRAREWGTSAWEARTSCCGRYELFKEEMLKIFDRSVFGREASRLLTTLHQGRRSVADFAIEFRTLAITCSSSRVRVISADTDTDSYVHPRTASACRQFFVKSKHLYCTCVELGNSCSSMD